MASSVFITMKGMHRGDVEAHRGRHRSWLDRLSEIALGYFTRQWNRLDIEEVPDSVKRDLGFLDGCAPYREEDRMH
ncbi:MULTISPECIES: hypothetical protein [unclassified Rhizobium]|uniref:hypothetical protein n=1 Tax=unclassified Rhizobium TaxID=2613769 RepID=UPI0017E5E209|nr:MULTISPECIES: hypothetical protein [unclassified Rhizobium]MBB3290718.1 hypothetical protein [Rhizobium sp. BK252]MBB3405498.1 hypothetical protein [Rhizobium sp. BK289]MBB3417999.1 hypothetical protein [Rhizobium sp. BK284]MBB3485924.1 hypothetical protein [Rhizobium sp. BK347]